MPDPDKIIAAARQLGRRGRPGKANLFPFNDFSGEIRPGVRHVVACGAPAGATYVVRVNGDVYPCIYLVGQEQYRLGNVTGRLDRRPLDDMLQALHVDHREGCRACAWRYACGGGCPVMNLARLRGAESRPRVVEYSRRITCDLSRALLADSLWGLADQAGRPNPHPAGKSGPCRCAFRLPRHNVAAINVHHVSGKLPRARVTTNRLMKVTSSNVLRFLRYVRPYRWTVALSAVVGVVQYNLPVIFPWILKDVIDNLLAGKPSLTGLSFNQLMGLSVALFALYALITSFRTYISYRLAHEIIFDVRKDLFQHLQHLPIDFFQKHQTGVIISRLITDVNNAQNFINIAGTNLFMDLTIIVSITFALFYMNWQLALIAYATLPVYVVLQKRVSERMRQKAREARRRMDVVEGNLHEAIAGIAEVKSFTHEQQEIHRFVTGSQGFLAAVSENIRTYALLLGSTTWLTRLTLVIVIWAGGQWCSGIP